MFDSMTIVDGQAHLSVDQKLGYYYKWQERYKESKAEDSVLGWIEFYIGKNEALLKNYSASIQHNLHALEINTPSKKAYSRILEANCFSAIAHNYDRLLIFTKALSYYDSTIKNAYANNNRNDLELDARLFKSYIFFRSGDYQKGIEESSVGITFSLLKGDTLYYLRFLNQRAQASFFQNQLQNALKDIETAIILSERLNQTMQAASAYKMLGYILARKRDFNEAIVAFSKSVRIRKQTKDYGQVAGDYNDFGNFYRDSLRLYETANKIYAEGLKYAFAVSDSIRLSRININLGKTYFLQSDYNKAAKCYTNAFRFLKLTFTDQILEIPPTEKINRNGNKELIIAALQTKSEVLLKLYQQTKDKVYKDACLKSSMATDTVITQMRHEQGSDQSKLYWRNRTRQFFSNAMEICFEASDPKHALYFMEKSRAVLLNDKLNELDAYSYLPQDSILIEQTLRISIIEQQQKLSSLSEGTPEYNKQLQLYLEKNSAFDNHIKSLEKNYFSYYQYKYADKVPSLTDLQQYLRRYNQYFIHYFVSDSVIYILAIGPTDTKMVKRSLKNYADTLSAFSYLCSNKQMLDTGYHSFSKASNEIYQTIFQNLDIPKGRVVICPDNFLIPFEALCSDKNGEKFLAYDYSFSYVYSANFLMKKFNNPKGKGNFLGLAPVNFDTALNLPSLKNADRYLERSSSYYSGTQLLTGNNASKRNFLSMLPEYEIINVFSHAKADNNDEEPVLFMCDSSIRLSELQKIIYPSAKLVVLSACQTNVGKKATGEGIYSLARGFAAAGIPGVAATMWKADDMVIYEITEKFHQNIAKGMRKDDALQQAKLSFMKNGGSDRSLPYYWANMIIIGNAEPIALSNDRHIWPWAGASVIFLAATALVIVKRRRNKAA